MKNRRGFTLIELLAVIVILAVIALIATPAIINVIDNARKKAFESTAYGVLEGLRLDYTERVVNNNTNIAKTFTFPNSGLKLSGEEPQYGKASIDPKGNIAFTLSDKDKRWCAKKDAGSEKVIVEDYSEETCTLDFSFEKDSWSTVSAVLKSNPKIYAETEEELIGKEREVKVEGYKNGTEDTFTVRLANLTPCTNEESETACGIVFEFVDIITKKKMNTETEENPYGTNKGGWPASELYNEVNTTIYKGLPEDLKKVIIDTKVVSSHGNYEINNFISIDKLYLLSIMEVWGNNSDYDSSTKSTRQLDYYRNNEVTLSNNLNVTIKKWNNSIAWWWLRSARFGYRTHFLTVTNTGANGANDSYRTSGVAPAFRIV